MNYYYVGRYFPIIRNMYNHVYLLVPSELYIQIILLLSVSRRTLNPSRQKIKG